MRRSSYSWSYADSVNGPSTARSQVCNFCQILAVDKKHDIPKTSKKHKHSLVISRHHVIPSNQVSSVPLVFALHAGDLEPSRAKRWHEQEPALSLTKLRGRKATGPARPKHNQWTNQTARPNLSKLHLCSSGLEMCGHITTTWQNLQ